MTPEEAYKASQKTEVYSPVPPIVTPGVNHAPPSDAIVLFDGTDLSKWKMKKEAPPLGWWPKVESLANLELAA